MGDALSTLAFVIAVASWLARRGPWPRSRRRAGCNDLGNLMLAFVMLWAYMSFCQFLIIWSGNLAEEIPWYLRRTRGAWQWVALALDRLSIFPARSSSSCSARTRRRPGSILPVALWVLAMRWVELVWLIIPASTDPASPRIPWIELPIALAATAGMGGIWVAVFSAGSSACRLCPQNDPSLNEALEHAGGSLPWTTSCRRRPAPAESEHGHEANTLSVRGLVMFATAVVALAIIVSLILALA